MADRRTVKERVAEAPKDNGGAAQQSSSEEDAAAVGSDQERRANFAKTVAAAFRDVSLKRLKANRQRAIVSASASIIAAAEVGFGQAPKSDLVKLQEEVARLTAALESILKENSSFRAELRKMREQEAERSGTTPQQPRSSPVESQVLAQVRQEMAAFQVRFSVLEGRVLRPPSRRRSPQRPKGPLMRLRLQRHPRPEGDRRASPLSRRRTGRPAKPQGRNSGPSAKDPGANSGTGPVGTSGGDTPSEVDSVCGPYLSCH
nr:uncharacterized protein LOC126057038 [Helicoverpa armigera]